MLGEVIVSLAKTIFPRGLSATSKEWIVTVLKLVKAEATFQVERS